jgi:hypothetical protein
VVDQALCERAAGHGGQAGQVLLVAPAENLVLPALFRIGCHRPVEPRGLALAVAGHAQLAAFLRADRDLGAQKVRISGAKLG